MTTRDYPDHPLVGVGAVIVHEQRAVIVRRARPPLAGEWSVPGGLLELGETLRAGVAREVLEETGLHVEVGPVLDVFDSIFPDANGRTQYHFVLIDFLCRITGGDLHPASDVSEARWISAAELESFPLIGFTAQVIKKGLSIPWS